MSKENPFKKVLTFFSQGVLIGVADLVPGISGGSVALALGIYERFLGAIDSFVSKQVLFLFITFRWKQLFEKVDGKFLLPVISGIVSAVVIFAHVFALCFSNPYYRFVLFSFFLGGMVAATLLIGKQAIATKHFDLTIFLLGTMFALILSVIPRVDATTLVTQMPKLSEHASNLVPMFQPTLILCGILAISAMLLPGISGSYILLILGVYPKVLFALTTFLSSMKNGIFDLDSFYVIINLSIGCLMGAFLFARLILWVLQKYRGLVLSFLLGLVSGSLKVLWPFTGSSLNPSVFSLLVFLSMVSFCAGFFIVLKMKREKEANFSDMNC